MPRLGVNNVDMADEVSINTFRCNFVNECKKTQDFSVCSCGKAMTGAREIFDFNIPFEEDYLFVFSALGKT